MAKPTEILCLALITAGCLARACSAAEPQTRKQSATRAPQSGAKRDPFGLVLAGSPQEAVDAFRYIHNVHGIASADVLEYAGRYLDDEDRKKQVRVLILLLGEYYSPQATCFLVNHIDLRLPTEIYHMGSMNMNTRHYPCAISLLRIGQSSVPWILQRLEDPQQFEISDKANELYARVLLGVYSSPRAVGGYKEAIAVVERAKNRAPEKLRPNHERLLAKLRELTKDRK